MSNLQNTYYYQEIWQTGRPIRQRGIGGTAGTNSLSQSILQKAIELRRDPSASMIGKKMEMKDGLIKDGDKDVENTKLAVVTRGNTDPEGDFNCLVEFVTSIQSQYQNRISSLSLAQLHDEARRESSLKGHIQTKYNTTSNGKNYNPNSTKTNIKECRGSSIFSTIIKCE